jgi:hypothetical protein
MEAKRGITWAFGLVAALIVVAAIVVYPKVVAEAPKDDAQLTDIKFADLMGTRYTEILVVFGNALKSEYVAGVYNTVGLNGANPAGGGDSSPAVILDKIDMKKVQEDNHALSTVKNGARFWTVDHIGVKAGRERDFQGLKARWVTWFLIPDAIREHKDLSYAVMNVRRDTSMSINKGSRAFILDDAEGNSWVMKSASLIVDPKQKLEDLKDLGVRLKTPAGWRFRSPVLEQELVFTTDNGKTLITQDELGNTYDRVGGPYSNYKP